jgi:hypothetical protein
VAGEVFTEHFLDFSAATHQTENGDYYWLQGKDKDLLWGNDLVVEPRRLVAFMTFFMEFEVEEELNEILVDHVVLEKMLQCTNEELQEFHSKVTCYMHSTNLRLWSKGEEFSLSGIYANVLNAYVRAGWQSITESLKDIVHVESLREIPQQVLPANSAYLNKYFGGIYSGKVQVNEIRQFDPFGFGKKERNLEKDLNLARGWFRELCDDKFDFEIEPILSSSGTTLAIRLSVISGPSVASFENVGSGLSQILPVVLALHTTGDSLALIEQPELHLHPKMQAQMADVILDSAKQLPRKQFFIETHSENLLLRFLRRLRETYLGVTGTLIYPEDMSIHQIIRDDVGSKILRLEVLESGEILESWTSGFVEIRLDDIL